MPACMLSNPAYPLGCSLQSLCAALPSCFTNLPTSPARCCQIGALVSMQSVPLRHGRGELEQRAERLEQQYADESVPVRCAASCCAGKMAYGGQPVTVRCRETAFGTSCCYGLVVRSSIAPLPYQHGALLSCCIRGTDERSMIAHALLICSPPAPLIPHRRCPARHTGAALCCARCASSSGRAGPAACTTGCGT